jgi:hypothetical protein
MLRGRGKDKMMEYGGLERRCSLGTVAVLTTQSGPRCEAQIQPSPTPEPQPDISRTPERNQVAQSEVWE